MANSYDNNGGVNLSTVGDDIAVILANSSLGHDAAGTFTIGSPTAQYAGAQILFKKAFTKADWDAGILTPLLTVSDNSTGLPLAGGAATLQPNAQNSYSLSQLTAYYGVIMQLTAITSGSFPAEGATYLGSEIGTALLAQMSQQNTLIKAQVLAMSDQAGTDYLEAVGGTW